MDGRLLAGVRVLCATKEQDLGGRSGADALGRWSGSPLPAAGEAAALKTLSGLAAIALSQFPGGIGRREASVLVCWAVRSGQTSR